MIFLWGLAVFNIQHWNSNSRRFLRIYFFLCIKLQERLIKIQCAHIIKSYLKFQHVPELSHSVHRGINPSSCQAPLFRQFPIYNCFFVTPSPKNWWTPIILKFFIFNPSYLLKVTKFLVKICQFKFLVLGDKHFGL